MGAHLIDGEFQSDKYPTTPRGKVPLSTKDKSAQDLLYEYASRREPVDAEFSDDLRAALGAGGFDPERGLLLKLTRGELLALIAAVDAAIRSGRMLEALGSTDGDVALIEAFANMKLLAARPKK